MLEISEADEPHLLRSISAGSGVIILGAGAVLECKNSREQPLKSAGELARLICEIAGIPYNGEGLDEVTDAARLPSVQLNGILEAEYKQCAPSNVLESLFNYTWRRIYTFNIDDCINAIRPNSKQVVYTYNSLSDKVAAYEGWKALHVAHLNGYVRALDKGVIFSKTDYDQHTSDQRAGWYVEAVKDYFGYCPIFIGTKLSEPLFWTELERSREREEITTLHTW